MYYTLFAWWHIHLKSKMAANQPFNFSRINSKIEKVLLTPVVNNIATFHENCLDFFRNPNDKETNGQTLA